MSILSIQCDLCSGELQMLPHGLGARCADCGMEHSFARLQEKLEQEKAIADSFTGRGDPPSAPHIWPTEPPKTGLGCDLCFGEIKICEGGKGRCALCGVTYTLEDLRAKMQAKKSGVQPVKPVVEPPKPVVEPVEPVVEPVKPVVEPTPDEEPPLPKNPPFCMLVENVTPITGVGVVVSGKIVAGTIRNGSVVQTANGKPCTVKAVEVDKKVCQTAQTGETVGLLLAGIDCTLDRTDFQIGDNLIASDVQPPKDEEIFDVEFTQIDADDYTDAEYTEVEYTEVEYTEVESTDAEHAEVEYVEVEPTEVQKPSVVPEDYKQFRMQVNSTARGKLKGTVLAGTIAPNANVFLNDTTQKARVLTCVPADPKVGQTVTLTLSYYSKEPIKRTIKTITGMPQTNAAADDLYEYGGTEEQYFEELLRRNFADYAISKGPQDPNWKQTCSWLLSKNGKPALLVIASTKREDPFAGEIRSEIYAYKGYRSVRFFMEFRNKVDFVVSRIRQALA
ncbi:MAG: hypothetical protein IJC93_03735 [Clostridia bacterium]|nr:hypothetical protein [Clostridia bacterium]